MKSFIADLDEARYENKLEHGKQLSLLLISSLGILKYDGGEYEGEILDGKAYGEGVYTKDGTAWTGTFLNNQFHGYCKFYLLF